MDEIDRIVDLMSSKGTAWYGREGITLEQHSLQAARLAERDAAPPALVAAALLHDLGHLLSKERRGTGEGQLRDDRHEYIAAGYLERLFGPAVAEPIRLHVDAKRFLCSVEQGYREALSPASVRSLALQGGVLGSDDVAKFPARPFAGDAIKLRRWDDLAKDPTVKTKPLSSYAQLLRSLALARADGPAR